jgi:Spy/CpxP family protein refolding chaperone
MRRASMIGALALGMVAAAAAVEAAPPITPLSDERPTGRGKHKARRHGQKMKRNRLTVSKRVRRKHRRAA